ncbi:MAG: CNNM domain-containing protein [Chryseolinea sp.]
MTFDVILTLFLVALNGFFVAAEFAIVKVRSSQIALEKGNLSKKAAQNIINNLDGYLAATQLGITLASLGLGWVGEDVMSRIILNLMSALGVSITTSMAHSLALPIAFAMLYHPSYCIRRAGPQVFGDSLSDNHHTDHISCVTNFLLHVSSVHMAVKWPGQSGAQNIWCEARYRTGNTFRGRTQTHYRGE